MAKLAIGLLATAISAKPEGRQKARTNPVAYATVEIPQPSLPRRGGLGTRQPGNEVPGYLRIIANPMASVRRGEKSR